MDWGLLTAALFIGIIIGYVLHSLLSRNGDLKSNNKQLAQAQLEMSQHKQEVADHIDEHQQRLHQLTQQLSEINQHWHDTTQQLGLGLDSSSLPIITKSENEESPSDLPAQKTTE